MKIITDGFLAVAIAAVIYILILAAFYGSDKQYCAGYGYDNTITPTFEGYCTRHLENGVQEIVPVEYISRLKRNPHAGEKGWRNDP